LSSYCIAKTFLNTHCLVARRDFYFSINSVKLDCKLVLQMILSRGVLARSIIERDWVGIAVRNEFTGFPSSRRARSQVERGEVHAPPRRAFVRNGNVRLQLLQSLAFPSAAAVRASRECITTVGRLTATFAATL
jgi:hypothetical protein